MAFLACGRSDLQLIEEPAPPGPGSLAPQLSPAAGGGLYLTWIQPRPEGGHAVRLAARRDGMWGAASTIVETDSLFANWADRPGVTELADGTLLAHWLARTAGATYAYEIRLAHSRDGGLTWGPPVVPHGDRSPVEHGFVSASPLGSGGALLLWLDQRESLGLEEGKSRMTLRGTLAGADGGVAPDTRVDDLVCDCCPTAMAVTASGVVAAYRDRTEDEIRDIAVVRWTPAGWSEPRVASADGWRYAACPVNGPALSARGDSVALAWFTAGGDDPRVLLARSTDGGRSFGPPVRVDDGRAEGRADVLLLAGGDVLVSWIRGAPPRGEVRLRRVGRDGTPGRVWAVTPDEAIPARSFPRLAQAGGDLVLAWREAGEPGGIRVARVRVPD